jgi:hypothetical protein
MLLVFDNLAAAKIANIVNLSVNTMVITKGYYEPGDGGGATYLVKSNQPPEVSKLPPFPEVLFKKIQIKTLINTDGKPEEKFTEIDNPFFIKLGDWEDSTKAKFLLQFDYQGTINLKQAGATSYSKDYTTPVEENKRTYKQDAYQILDYIINQNPFVKDEFLAYPNQNDNYVKNIYAAEVLIPPGTYFLSQTLEIKRTVYLHGTNTYYGFATNTVLIFSKKVTGIKLAYVNQVKDTSSGRQGAGGSIVEGLKISSFDGVTFFRYDSTTETYFVDNRDYGDNHGILMNIGCKITNCVIQGFEGDGIRVIGSTNVKRLEDESYNDKISNANLFYLDHVTTLYVGGNGIYLAGNNANAGKIIGSDTRYTGRFGILDESMLGNTYIACHASACGIRGNCFNKGKFYYLKVNLNEENKLPVKNIEPGVSQDWEKYWVAVPSEPTKTTSDAPQWDSSFSYTKGGSYYSVGSSKTVVTVQEGATDGTNNTESATSVFVGCYSELDSQYRIKSGSMIVGGIITSGGKNDNCFVGPAELGYHPIEKRDSPEDLFFDVLVGTGNNVRVRGAFSTGQDDPKIASSLTGETTYDHRLGSQPQIALQSGQNIKNSRGQATLISLGYIGSTHQTFGIRDFLSDSTKAWEVTTSTYQDQDTNVINHGGRKQGLPSGKMLFQQGFFLGSSGQLARFQGNASTPPLPLEPLPPSDTPQIDTRENPEFGQGDILWNSNPSKGGNIGWVCVNPGTPGDWVPFGKIDETKENKASAVTVKNSTDQNVIVRFYNVGDIVRAITLPDGEKIVAANGSLVWNLPPGLQEVAVTFNASSPINVKLGETVTVPT